jgi:acetyl esterase/lipase
MRGLARELIKGGKYVVASIDYRWIANMDGDETPNQMHQLIEDCYGAVLHIQEHAAEYGIDPSRIALTGDSAGGHLSSSLANMVERVGDAGFGAKEGVFEFCPTYLPEGMDLKNARKSLHAIKAVAPSYGVFDCGSLKYYVRSLPEKFRSAVAPMDNIPSAEVREVPQYLVLGTKDRTVSREQMEIYVAKLKEAGHKAELVIVEDAAHAFFDWKPDQETKDIFAQYGVPYAADMMRFFDEVFYK